jgi:hypothetical protein
VRVYEASGKPPIGFAPVVPTLEDAYLLTMRGDLPNSAKIDASRPEFSGSHA